MTLLLLLWLFTFICIIFNVAYLAWLLILGGTKHWEKARSDEEPGSANTWRPPYVQSRSVDIEMTAYALLVHSLNGDLSGAVPIAKWIISQRNPNGGFSSTQVSDFQPGFHGIQGFRGTASAQ